MGEAVEEQVILAERLTEPELSLPDMLRIKGLARQNSAERRALERIDREFADKHAAGLGPGANVRLGLIAWTRGKLERAREALEQVRSQPESRFLLGHIAWEEVKLDEAADHLAAAAKSLSDPTPARTAQIEILIQQRRADEADKLLADLEKRLPEKPDVLYLRGRHLELDHQLEEALDSYEAALAADPHHAPSAFRKACILDLYGADQQAMALYRRCGRDSGSYVGALMNLGLFHDDRDEYEEAMSCFREVLRIEPNNRRAQLYYKGAEASIDMYYDEAQRKEQERIEQILRTPITDFEFSVRSRNCLAKMNIRTLGDLIHKTEAEMLAYKNFGETSLREIKEVLEAKNLSLGMALEGTEKKTKERLRSLVSVGSDSEILMRPVGDLELSVRSRKAMEQLDIQTIGDLVTRTEAELMTVKNFGQTSLNEITQKLQESGLTLKPMNV